MKQPLNHVSLWFGLIMIVLVFSGAVAFAFTDFMLDRLYGTRRLFFIGILIAYGIYRSFRIYQVYQRSKHE